MLDDSDFYGIDRSSSAMWTDSYISNISRDDATDLIWSPKYIKKYIDLFMKREAIYKQNKRYRMFSNIRRFIWLSKRKLKKMVNR